MIIASIPTAVISTLLFSYLDAGPVSKILYYTVLVLLYWGLISTIGYLPEIFISLIAGSTLEKYPGVTGYCRYFIFVIVMMIIGTVFVAVWRTYLNKKAKSAK